MEEKYGFKLTPAYCLFNGIVVKEQNGAEICFFIENPNDEILKGRIKRAFCKYVDFVTRQDDCGENYRVLPKIEFEKGDRAVLRQYVSRLYGENKNYIAAKNNDAEDSNKSFLDQKKKEAAAVILLDSILFEARSKGATDIHIEKNAIKMRINGLLEFSMEINDERKKELIQRIKLLSGMNSLERRKSQDGHFVYGGEKPIFVRVSSVAVINEKYCDDESVVLRILDTSKLPLGINFLGFNQVQIEKINNLCDIKNGLVLVCGPTCSGKSTTVASILLEIEKNRNSKVKIISLEDPPEYIIPGVTQLKISEDSGKTFSKSLEYIFRQDPDVIMIGEIRDKESAETAIRAALTGHLVFATVHTGSAGEAVLRLENLSIERKIITSVLKGVILQELKYVEQVPNLYADVAIPNYDFSWIINEEMGANEIDEYYEHFTNYVDSLARGISIIGKIKSKKINLWGGESNDRKVHKRII